MISEERLIYLQKLQAQQMDMDEVRGRLEAKVDEFEMLEKEYKK